MPQRVMVCVTQQKTCDRLIQFGHDLLENDKSEFFIIHVAHYQLNFLGSSQEGEALEYLYEKAFDYGAQLTVVRSNHVLDTLVDLVKKYKITHIVLGQSGDSQDGENLIEQLSSRIKKHTQVIVVPA